MDYLTYESFIHPEVLSAFLVKEDDVTFKVSGDYPVGAEYISVENTKGIFAGNKFIHNGVVYVVRTVDSIKNTILINQLKTTLSDGSELVIIKEDRREALRSFYNAGEKDFNAFERTLSQYGVPVRFDSDVYILKVAFIAMYKWILQSKAFLRDLNLTGVGIPKSQIFDHFYKLLQAETEELEALRKEAMDELKQKQQNDADGKSGTGFVRYNTPRRNHFTGYRR